MLNNGTKYIHTSKGKNNELYTKKEGVLPLLNFLKPFKEKIIWCPFDTESSEFVKEFTENGFNVIYSSIESGQDFYTYQPENWDVLISNPPFTNKRGIVERALSFNKPFALLLPITWLNDAAPAQVFKNRNFQILSFDRRMTFKNSPKGKQINFLAAYFCVDFLPKGFIFEELYPSKQVKLNL